MLPLLAHPKQVATAERERDMAREEARRIHMNKETKHTVNVP